VSAGKDCTVLLVKLIAPKCQRICALHQKVGEIAPRSQFYKINIILNKDLVIPHFFDGLLVPSL